MAESEIRAAVEAARKLKPSILAGLADKYIAAGKSTEAVKAELCERIIGTFKPDAAEATRADAVAKLGEQYGATASTHAGNNFGRSRGVDPKASTIGNPGFSANTGPTLTVGQKSMLDSIERKWGKDARAKAEAKFAARVR